MSQKRRSNALFFIPTLEMGGAERVCLHYINNLKEFRPVLVVQFLRGELLDELRPGIPIIPILRYPGFFEKRSRRGRTWRWKLRKRRRILKVRIRYLRKKVRCAMEAKGYARAIRTIEAIERVLGVVVESARRILFGARRKGSDGFDSNGPWSLRRVTLLPKRLWFLLQQARRLSQSVQETKSDIVVSFLPFTNIIALFTKLFFVRRLKVIINVHGINSRLLADYPADERFLTSALIRMFYCSADSIVVVSEGIRIDLVDNYGVPDEKIRVVHNPIDRSLIRSMGGEETGHPWFESPNGFLAVAVGRLTAVKGFDLLIDAFASLPPETGARLVIIGDGEERDALIRRVDRAGLRNRVEFLGSQKNPWKYMRRADCIVLSSRSEGLPNVIGEALALGRPILAADCSPGVREYLLDGRHGLLIPANDAPALARGLGRMMSDAGLRSRYRDLADERAAHFDSSRMIEMFENNMSETLVN